MRPVRTADNLTTFMCRLSWNLGASTFWNPQGLSRAIMWLHRQVPSRCGYGPSNVPTETNHPVRPLKRQSCKTCFWETLVNAQTATKTTLISSCFLSVSSCTHRYIRRSWKLIILRYHSTLSNLCGWYSVVKSATIHPTETSLRSYFRSKKVQLSLSTPRRYLGGSRGKPPLILNLGKIW
jgi:hypothetical protein